MSSLPETSAAAIRAAHAGEMPRTALQLGSGLNSIAESLSDATVLSYGDIEGFPVPTVEGHAGRLLIGKLADVPVLCLQGRVHLYEGQGLSAVLTMIRALKLLGVENLVLTNAAGSLNPDFGPGRLMVINDHINMSGANPLIGPNDNAFGVRFPDMSEAWNRELIATLHAAGGDAGIELGEGVYIMVAGPNFETPAEIIAYRTLGADAVGMSTVPECLVANHAGLRVAGITTITNLAAGLSAVPLTHAETMEEGAKAAANLTAVLTAFLKRLG